VAFLCLKERLLNFTVNSSEPIFRMSGTVTKMSSLGLELSRSFFGSSQLERQLMREIHRPHAVVLRHIRGLLQHDNDGTSGIIRQHSGVWAFLIRGERNNGSRPLVWTLITTSLAWYATLRHA
jgi:hypothetical protein